MEMDDPNELVAPSYVVKNKIDNNNDVINK